METKGISGFLVIFYLFTFFLTMGSLLEYDFFSSVFIFIQIYLKLLNYTIKVQGRVGPLKNVKKNSRKSLLSRHHFLKRCINYQYQCTCFNFNLSKMLSAFIVSFQCKIKDDLNFNFYWDT
jgi:hypothetical protein